MSEVMLLVDDDDVFRRRLGRALRERGFEVKEAGDGVGAEREIRSQVFHRAVIDLRMPATDGLQLVRTLRQVQPNLAILMLTGYGSIATAVEAMRLGACNYLTKPATVDEILEVFKSVEAPLGSPGAAPDETPSLARVEWEHLQRVLQDCQGNISQAARQLGIHRRSLQRKLGKNPVTR